MASANALPGSKWKLAMARNAKRRDCHAGDTKAELTNGVRLVDYTASLSQWRDSSTLKSFTPKGRALLSALDKAVGVKHNHRGGLPIGMWARWLLPVDMYSEEIAESTNVLFHKAAVDICPKGFTYLFDSEEKYRVYGGYHIKVRIQFLFDNKWLMEAIQDFTPNTPLGIVADWLEDRNMIEEAEILRSL